MEINELEELFAGIFEESKSEEELTTFETYLRDNSFINVEFANKVVVYASYGAVTFSLDGKEICRINSHGKQGTLSLANGKIPPHVFKWIQRIEESIKIHEKLERELTTKIEQLENTITTLHANEHATLDAPIEEYVKEKAEEIEKIRTDMQSMDIKTLTRKFMEVLFYEFAETQFLQRDEKQMRWNESFLAKEAVLEFVEYEENEEIVVEWEPKEEKILFTFCYNGSETEVRESEGFIWFYNQGEWLYFTSKEDMHRGGYDAGRYELKKHIPKNMLDVLRDIEEIRDAWRCEWVKYHDEDSAPIEIYKILQKIYLKNGHTGKLVSGDHYQTLTEYGKHIQKLDRFKNEIESKFQELDSILENLSS